MTPSSRDRLSVDLHGLKAVLFERAQALGVSPSGLVRTTLAEVLGQSEPVKIDRSAPSHLSGKGDRVRLSLRMTREQATATLDAARRAGLNLGDYVGGLPRFKGRGWANGRDDLIDIGVIEELRSGGTARVLPSASSPA